MRKLDDGESPLGKVCVTVDGLVGLVTFDHKVYYLRDVLNGASLCAWFELPRLCVVAESLEEFQRCFGSPIKRKKADARAVEEGE